MTNNFDNADVQPDDLEDEEWDEGYDPIAEQKEQRRRRIYTIFSYVLTLVVGLTVGTLVTRQRYHAMKAIVSINGQTINEDGFVHRMEVASGRQTLERLANEMLQDQYAKKLGVVVTKEEVVARYRDLSSRPEFPQYMATTHQGPEDIANDIRLELTVNKIVGRNVTVTDAEARNYYKQQTDKSNPQARFYTPPKATIQVITSRDKSRVLAAKAELDRGADFNSVAAKYSDDLTSKDHGGELPPLVRGRTVYSRIKGLEEVVFDTKTGEQRGPIQFGPLWSILRCVKQEPDSVVPYDKVQYECRVGAMMSRLPPGTAKAIRDNYIKFQQSAVIHTFRPEYKMVFGGR